jgi:hypothetical protein
VRGWHEGIGRVAGEPLSWRPDRRNS